MAFDLLVEMVKGNVENYAILHSKVIQQHSKGNWPKGYFDYNKLFIIKTPVDPGIFLN
jgi:hypothetical protein